MTFHIFNAKAYIYKLLFLSLKWYALFAYDSLFLFLFFFIFKQVTFQVADALEQPFPDGQFDLVWSMESGEHMPDKEKVNNT